jgi:hypothetical protein
MKKLIAVPVVAVLAAGAAASAAGFAGGVTAGPIQSGDNWDLECAASAQVVEWGTNDHHATPNVVNALVKLNSAECQGQAVHLIALKPDGTELARFKSEKLKTDLASGTQYVRLEAKDANGVPVKDLRAIRITIDGGSSSMPFGGSNTPAGA